MSDTDDTEKYNLRLLLRIGVVVLLTVVVLVAVLFAPQHVTSNMPIDTMKGNNIEEGAYSHTFDVSAFPLDMNVISNHKYWIDKKGLSQCHYRDALYPLGTDCLSQQCHSEHAEDPTFDNQLMLETDGLWTNDFMQQIDSINQSLIEYNGTFRRNSKFSPILLSRTRMDSEGQWNAHWFHMALEYFCCFTAKQYRTISNAMDQFEFVPFEVQFDRILCIGDSLALFVDAVSQQYLASLTDRIEEYLRDDWNISIHSHRRDAQPFHVTLLRIENGEDSENEMLDLVQYLNERHQWDGVTITVDKSCICMNGKEQYDIEYSCF